eukprot:31240-Pelagococcus_subviridis.AAC.2
MMVVVVSMTFRRPARAAPRGFRASRRALGARARAALGLRRGRRVRGRGVRARELHRARGRERATRKSVRRGRGARALTPRVHDGRHRRRRVRTRACSVER